MERRSVNVCSRVTSFVLFIATPFYDTTYQSRSYWAYGGVAYWFVRLRRRLDSSRFARSYAGFGLAVAVTIPPLHQ